MSNPEKIALLTDSTADLPAPMREGKPIYVVPLKIRCEDGEYSDGEDITAEGYMSGSTGESCPAPRCPRAAWSATRWIKSVPTGTRG